jgi:hypothetical protein
MQSLNEIYDDWVIFAFATAKAMDARTKKGGNTILSRINRFYCKKCRIADNASFYATCIYVKLGLSLAR